MIAFRIKEAMKASNHSAEYLAYRMGWDEKKTLAVIDGREGLTADQLHDIACILGTTMQELLPDVSAPRE